MRRRTEAQRGRELVNWAMPAASRRQQCAQISTLSLVGTGGSGLLRSTDGGASFEVTNACEQSRAIVSITPFPNDELGSRIGATCWREGFAQSRDAAKSWGVLASGLTKDSQADFEMHYSPHFLGITYSTSSVEGQRIYVGGYDGLFVSTDGGSHWSELHTFSERRIVGLNAITLADGNDLVALATYEGGAYLWQPSTNQWSIANRGLRSPRLSEITFVSGSGQRPLLVTGERAALLTLRNVDDGWRTLAFSNGRIADLTARVLRKVGLGGLLERSELAKHLGLTASKVFPQLITPLPQGHDGPRVLSGTREEGVISIDLETGRHEQIFLRIPWCLPWSRRQPIPVIEPFLWRAERMAFSVA